MIYFEYKHEVGMDETDRKGNVRSVHFLQWQRYCMEDFLRQHSTGGSDVESCVQLLVRECGCNYLDELRGVSPFDVVAVRMRPADVTPTEISVTYEYVLISRPYEQLVATGWHRATCVRRRGDQVSPAEIPSKLCRALERYGAVSTTMT